MKKIIVGARGSKLSLIQSRWVLKEIKKKNPGFDYELKIIKTAGDHDKKTSLAEIKNKDFFTDTIQRALSEKEIDMAIHSMKDLSVEMPETLMLARVPKREDPRDVIVFKEQYKNLAEVPKDLKIGTSSQKRGTLIQEELNEAKVLPIRGNVDERVEQVNAGVFDGTVLAAAGLLRLDMSHVIDFYFDAREFIPAPAQGILAIQLRTEDQELLEVVNSIAHEASNIQNKTERAFYALSEGKYQIIGGYCEVTGDTIELYGMLGNAKGSLKSSKKAVVGEEIKLAEELFKEMSEALKHEK